MRKVLVDGVNLHIQQSGTGSDVVLVHGITSNLSRWLLTVMPRLAERHRVTAYDLRGHGFSDVPPTGYTSGDLAEELRGLMDGLDIERAHVVGHSFGGAIALNCAVRYPERFASLVIEDAAIPALRWHRSFENWPWYAKFQEYLSPHGVTLPTDPDSWDPSELLHQLPKFPTLMGLRRGLPLQHRRVQRLISTTTCFADLRVVGDLTEERIRTVAVPTLAVYYEHSPFLSIGRYLEEHLPRCRLHVERGFHLFPTVAPDAIAEPLLGHFAVVDGELRHDATPARF